MTPPLTPIQSPTEAPSASIARTASVGSFGNMLLGGIVHVNSSQLKAEKLATDFALDDSVPLHQVTFALQQARLSLEMMVQMRSRLVDAYQQLANLQL